MFLSVDIYAFFFYHCVNYFHEAHKLFTVIHCGFQFFNSEPPSPKGEAESCPLPLRLSEQCEYSLPSDFPLTLYWMC